MIKWPEPAGYIRKDQLQKVQQGWAYLCDVGPEPRADKQPIHTEAQLKQVVRDALQHAADEIKVEADYSGSNRKAVLMWGVDKLRALIKEIPE